MNATAPRVMMLLAAIFCLDFLAGCGGGKGDVAGVYELDTTGIKEAMRASLEGEGHPDAERGAALFGAMIQNIVMRLTLNEDGTAAMYVKDLSSEGTGTGTWTLREDATITINVTAPGEPMESVTGHVSENTITMRAKENDPDDMPFDLVFRRQKKTDK